MKVIDVKDQVSLPFAKCVELVISGIKYRLFRAAVTVTIIALAVAFLMAMLSESIVARKVASQIDVQLEPTRNFAFWVGRLADEITDRDLTDQLANMQPDDARWKEFAAWGNLDESQLSNLQSVAANQQMHLDFFAEDLDEGERRPMLGRARGVEIFVLLQDAEAYAQFKEEITTLGRKMDTDLETFKAFLGEWENTHSLRKAIVAGHLEAQQKVKTATGGKNPEIVLAQADQSFVDMLAGHGFVLNSDNIDQLRSLAKINLDRDHLLRIQNMGLTKSRLAMRMSLSNVMDADEDLFFSFIKSSKGAKWLIELTSTDTFSAKAAGLGIPLLTISEQRIREIANHRIKESRLWGVKESVSNTIGADKEGFLGYSSRTLWLITVSFMVCVVGIANAMLMSVTERFREIATMKCLGATDAFIMINFVLESCLQGLAGGIVGAIVGFGLGALRSLVSYGWMAMEHVPWSTMFATAGVAIVVGIILSALAAVYPAHIAAKLAPMEAMRIE